MWFKTSLCPRLAAYGNLVALAGKCVDTGYDNEADFPNGDEGE